jgi:hypothetical protein
MGGVERVLLGFAVIVAMVTTVWAGWCFLFTEPVSHASWRTKLIWGYGGVAVAVCIGTVAVLVLLALSRLVMG